MTGHLSVYARINAVSVECPEVQFGDLFGGGLALYVLDLGLYNTYEFLSRCRCCFDYLCHIVVWVLGLIERCEDKYNI